MAIPGLRTELFKMTRKKQKNPRSNVQTMQFFEDSSPQGIIKAKQVKGGGAPRTEVLVGGTVKLDAILDGGASSCIMSSKLVKTLNIETLEPAESIHGMADGRSSRPLGEVKGLVVNIQGLNVVIDAVVYELVAYDLLLGSDVLHTLGIFTDWATHFWSMKTPEGTTPLKVHYQMAGKFDQLDSTDDNTSYSGSADEESTEEDSYSESFLVFPVMYDEIAEESYTVQNQVNGTKPGSSAEEIEEALAKSVDKSKLTEKEKSQLLDKVRPFQDCFGLDYQDLKQTNLLKLHIDTGNANPVMKRPNKFMSHAELELLEKEIETMLHNGQLVPATHAPGKNGIQAGGWSFPALYVKKKNGERRFCVQFQDLNKVTVKDPWPLPSITDLLESYKDASVFSTVDLLKGFNQIAVSDDTIPKLTVATPWGCFSFKVMPFGIVNGPATFSRAIYLAMQGYLNQFVTTYIDDITVYSPNLEEHIKHLELVLQRIREVNMVLNPKKCVLAAEEVEVLGFVVSKAGIKPHPNNVAKIVNFPRPKNKTDIRAFVSLAGFYRRHAQNFSELVASLNRLLGKKVDFTWTEIGQNAFECIKRCIVNAAVLQYSDPKKPYKLFTDASDIGIGAVLTQYDEDLGSDRPICFLSRKMIAAEINYPTVEKELLAVIYAMKKLRKYLLDKDFDLYTDNTAVRYLFCKSDPIQRLQRWIMAVQEYSFKVHHLPGKSNCFNRKIK